MPRLRLPGLAAVIVVACIVLGMAWELVSRMIYRLPVIDDQLARSVPLSTFVLLAWSAMYTSLVYRDRADAEAARALKAIALATEAQIAMLRYRVVLRGVAEPVPMSRRHAARLRQTLP